MNPKDTEKFTVSGIFLHELQPYWEMHQETITKQLLQCEYVPQLIHNRITITALGKHHITSQFSSIDHLLLQALRQVLSPYFEKQFCKHSFAYQGEKGTERAVKCAADYISAGKEFVIELKISEFFDHILHETLLNTLSKHIQDNRLLILLERYIACKVECDYTIQTKTIGLLLEHPLSFLLGELYLTEFDRWMETQGYSFVRFADTLRIYVSTLQEAYETLSCTEQKLKEFGLLIASDKKGIYPVFSRNLLGYRFEKSGDSILIQKNTNPNGHLYENWHKSALEKVNQHYHIINDGILTKKDYSILFENETDRISIPVEATNSINIYSDVILSSHFLSLISEKKISVTIFDTFGNYVGSFYSGQQQSRMETLIAQVQIYADPKKRLHYAKTIESAAMHNLRCNLKYYEKQTHSEILKESIQYFTEAILSVKKATSIEQLLLTEARCRQKYYQCINEMIHQNDFKMMSRSKRPPKDAINALISFGNACLYQRISQLIHRTSVDIRISFIHSAMKRYENLNTE